MSKVYRAAEMALEKKGVGNRFRGWQSSVRSANYIDLRPKFEVGPFGRSFTGRRLCVHGL